MSYFWIEKPNGDRGCVIADQATAEKHGRILGTLPYPASPVLERAPGDDCPPFCYTPNECLGAGSCHKNHACDD
jgi:hypothetical protein